MTAGLVTLWIGEALGAVERACLRSLSRQGHEVALYAYRRPVGVPERVTVRDAAEVLPESAIFRSRSGSVAPFADWFRYELMARSAGTWVDTDVYALRPIDGEAPYLFGEQAPGVINNAVLRMPAEAPMLAELLRPFRERATPDWLPQGAYLRARLRAAVTGAADPGGLPWGATGPHAVTALARRYGLDGAALPRETFYPAPWQEAGWIADPAQTLEARIGERTVAVHLWNERIAAFKDRPAAAGSFLHRLQQEGAL